MEADLDLNCREASRLLSLAFERALTEPERTALRRHLDECLMCVNFEAQLRFLRAAASRYREG
ncbi:MAG TPA: zf-HC2 domain-containing protein [Usitatibacter sp.]|nr:zf-HC2 domain-containing protein [Usitatibacter sp.]